MSYFILGVLCLLMFAFLSKRSYSAAVLCGIWIFTIVLMGNNEISMLSSKTLLLIGTMLLFTLLGLTISRYRFTFGDKPRTVNNGSSSSIYHINYLVAKYLLMVCLLIFLYYFLITVRNAGGINLNLIRHLNSSNNEESAFNGYTATFLFFMIAQPLFTVLCIAFIYALFNKNVVPRSIWVLTILDAILYLITNAGRIFIIALASFVLAAFLLSRARKNSEEKVSSRKIIFAVIVGILGLNAMTSSRTAGSSSFFEQAAQYIGCSVKHMDVQLTKLLQTNTNSINFGYYVYGGYLYYPIKVINILFGTNIQIPAEHLEYLQTISMISFHGNNVYYNALVPNAFYYYFDSGFLGVVVFSFISGFMIGKSEKKAIVNKSFKNFAYYAIGIYCLIFSPLGSQAWKTYIPMTIIWTMLLSRFVTKVEYLE